MKRYISKNYSKLYKTLKVELFPKINTAELNYGPFHILKNEKPLPPRRLFACCFSSNDYKLASNQPDILDNLKKLLEDYMKFKAEDFLVKSKDQTMLFPELNLFIWSLLLNRIELAKYFWRIGSVSFKCSNLNSFIDTSIFFCFKNQTASALFASVLLKNMAKDFHDSKNDFLESSM